MLKLFSTLKQTTRAFATVVAWKEKIGALGFGAIFAVFSTGILSLALMPLAHADSGYGSFCNGNNNNYCLWSDKTEWDPLTEQPYYTGGAQQTLTEHNTSLICGPVIGNGCAPFNNGSGENTQFSGLDMVQLQFSGFSNGAYCVGIAGSGTNKGQAVLDPCTNTNSVFVPYVIGDEGNGHTETVFIPVNYVNANNLHSPTVYAVDGPGNGRTPFATKLDISEISTLPVVWYLQAIL